MSKGLIPPGCEERAAARRGWWLLGILCLGTVAYWSVQYHPFVLPNNDYHSFERAAQSLASGELPAKFKRGPIFPSLMAVLAPVMPGPHPHPDPKPEPDPEPHPHPELHAALVLNMAFSIGVLILLFRLASPLLGAGALLVPALFATSEQFHAMALQPLVEPSLGFFCVLSLVLFQARSPWQYAAAAAAALSRSEAATLIPVLFLLNWAHDRRFWKHAALAALASIPFLAWVARGRDAGIRCDLLSRTDGRNGMGVCAGVSGELLPGALRGLVPGWLRSQGRLPAAGGGSDPRRRLWSACESSAAKRSRCSPSSDSRQR